MESFLCLEGNFTPPASHYFPIHSLIQQP